MKDKYIVFKREEFKEWYEDEREMALSEPVPPPDEVERVMVIEMVHKVRQEVEGNWA